MKLSGSNIKKFLPYWKNGTQDSERTQNPGPYEDLGL